MTARVLVVDDILPNVKLLEARLTAEYFDVLTAMNGPEALAICEQGACDIVLLDVMMPGMDGFEVCRRLKNAPDDGAYPGRHGHGARPAVRPGAGARSRRRRFPDQAGRRHRAVRAGAQPGAAEDGDRRAAHAAPSPRATLGIGDPLAAAAAETGQAAASCSSTTAPARPSGCHAALVAAPSGRCRDRPAGGAVRGGRRQPSIWSSSASTCKASTACGCAASCARWSARATCRVAHDRGSRRQAPASCAASTSA